MIDLKQLKAFSTLAEFGSFSRSAGVLGVAQPVLSRQIKALEQELGVELFYRNGRGTVLTEAGKVLNQYAKNLVETVDRAASEVMALKSSPRGTIVIGLPPSVGIVLTVPLVQHFREAFPLISLRVIEGFSGHVLEWLLTGKIDVAVLYNAPRTGSLRAEPLLTDELFLLGPAEGGIVPDAESVTARLLSEIPLILPARPHGLRMLVDSMLGEAGIVPRVEIEVEAMPSTLGLVENGVGYTILSYSTAHARVQAGRMRAWRIVEPGITRQLILATSSQRPTTPAMRSLVAMVRQEVRSLTEQGLWLPKGR
ncbi:LysR substrate-binding domain-containing protein [Bosea sp. 124]|uniref:LysR substrate-binding domain-containing protein n=1 Tax=Bosea sp. 124 TaxID=2135642 RepID=UPI000D4EFF5B|nr:LysR substrate-binding domain-containing protein [Bosea sp. 124]PTM39767.1 LysR family nitrogen assimilation transcriptional regulator [Bosea sp. 124]